MKTKRNICLGLLGVLFLGGLVVWGFLRVAGVQRIYTQHVIATVEVTGLQSEAEAGALEAHMRGLPGVREIDFARASWTNQVWMARLQFKAASPEDGAVLMTAWLDSLRPSHPIRLIKATHYEWRLTRPGRGDIAFGKRTPIGIASRP